MSSDLQLLDILFFAMLAGFLFFRLHRVLGKRTGHEQPQNPEEVGRDPRRHGRLLDQLSDDVPSDDQGAEEQQAEAVPGMDDLRRVDPQFRRDEFLSGVETAFEMIIDAFSRGDRDVLEALLDTRTLGVFETEIERRQQAHEAVDSSLISIDSCDLVEVKVRKTSVQVTVNIVSQQMHIVRNSDTGDVVAGDVSNVATVNDLWTFARDAKSADPNWRLIATRPGA